MIVIVKDYQHGDCVICRLEFASKEEADEKMPGIMGELGDMYGSGSCGFYCVIESADDMEPIG